MPTELAPDTHTEPEFVCACEEEMRTACAGEGFFREREGKHYCVFHYPSQDKLEAFRVALKKKSEAQDFDFRGVWFPEDISFQGVQFNADADFYRVTFSAQVYFTRTVFGAFANFDSAIFSADADFRWASFSAFAYFGSANFKADVHFFGAAFSAVANFDSSTFNAIANFHGATFSSTASFYNSTFSAEANFLDAIFSAGSNFDRATFNGDANFYRVTFSLGADFRRIIFSASANFSEATFKECVRFAGSAENREVGEQPRFDLQFAHIEKPDQVSFQSLDLCPHWFVNVDPRTFEFSDVVWLDRLEEELKSLEDAKVSAPNQLLAITYRRLAVNAEENHRYGEAAEFRYGSMDLYRLEEWRGMAFWRLAWWYWLLSGYGERITRAAGCLLLILVLFAGLYTQVGFVRPADQTTKATAITTTPDTVGTPLHFTQALVYSFEVSILQKPEPKPLTLVARFLVGLETVLGPLQAALLALAIRRKFMR